MPAASYERTFASCRSRGCGGTDRDFDRMSVSVAASPRNHSKHLKTRIFLRKFRFLTSSHDLECETYGNRENCMSRPPEAVIDRSSAANGAGDARVLRRSQPCGNSNRSVDSEGMGIARSRLAARSAAIRNSLSIALTAAAPLPSTSSRDVTIWIAPAPAPARSARPRAATSKTWLVQSTRATAELSMSRSRAPNVSKTLVRKAALSMKVPPKPSEPPASMPGRLVEFA